MHSLHHSVRSSSSSFGIIFMAMESQQLLLSSLCSLLLFATNLNRFVQARDCQLDLETYIVHARPPEDASLDSSFQLENWYKSFLANATANGGGEERMVHMYSEVVGGFAARLTAQELRAMSGSDGFLHAYPDRVHSVQTTHSPDFLGLTLGSGLWKGSGLGEGVVIGVVDTGVLPTHVSFSDEGMPPPPSKFRGRCEFAGFECNNKIVGARAFFTPDPGAERSPRDGSGHGSHVAGVAAGAPVPGAGVFGTAEGTSSGIAPRAHLAIYKVCNGVSCATTDIIAGIDAAVADGVDVISLAIGGSSRPFFDDGVSIGAFRAAERGVFVSAAAGNAGPDSNEVVNDAPWLTTVGASTTDRALRATVRLGDGVEYNGESAFQPKGFDSTFFPLVYAGANGGNASFCGEDSLDGLDVRGKVVLCEVGGDSRKLTKGFFVKKAGGAGMIVMSGEADAFGVLAEAHVLPASHVSFADGTKIKEYIASTEKPTATIAFKGAVLDSSAAPAVAAESPAGPSLQTPGILKPDVVAPGTSILAAYPFRAGPALSSSSNVSFAAATNFNVLSGTSVSAPHVAGIAALIKKEHPDWSPAAIKSAMMTTADTLDRAGEAVRNKRNGGAASFFEMGAGQVNPDKASDPGLVYDVAAGDYVPFLCGLGYTSSQVKTVTGSSVDCAREGSIEQHELNYPSISVTLGGGVSAVTVVRTAKNVGAAKSTYALVGDDAPAGVLMEVEPKELRFSKLNQEIKFSVRISLGLGKGKEAKGYAAASVSQGSLKWISGKYTVTSPITVAFKN